MEKILTYEKEFLWNIKSMRGKWLKTAFEKLILNIYDNILIDKQILFITIIILLFSMATDT